MISVRKRLVAAFVAAVVSVSSAAFAVAAPSGGQTTTVQVGALLDLSGDGKTLGLASEAALEVAAGQVEEESDGEIAIDLDIRDTGLDPMQASTELQSLLDSGVRVVIGPQTSSEVRATIDQVNGAGALDDLAREHRVLTRAARRRGVPARARRPGGGRGHRRPHREAGSDHSRDHPPQRSRQQRTRGVGGGVVHRRRRHRGDRSGLRARHDRLRRHHRPPRRALGDRRRRTRRCTWPGSRRWPTSSRSPPRRRGSPTSPGTAATVPPAARRSSTTTTPPSSPPRSTASRARCSCSARSS